MWLQDLSFNFTGHLPGQLEIWINFSYRTCYDLLPLFQLSLTGLEKVGPEFIWLKSLACITLESVSVTQYYIKLGEDFPKC